MKNQSSSNCGFIHVRRMLAVLLFLSGISLAMLVAATSSDNTLVIGPKTKISSPKANLSTGKGTTANSSNPTTPSVPTAPTPASGTLSPGNPTITYTDGPLIPNTTGLLGPPVCSAPGLCSDFVLTVNAASVAATQQIFIEGTWTPAQNDFDYFIENTSGQVIAANQSTANPSALILPIPANGTVYHIVTEASLGAGNLSFVVKLINKPNPVNQGPGAPPRYKNYPSGESQANDAGEPSIGVDWNPNVANLKHDQVNTGGMAFFTSNFNQYQASFDDCSSPALNPWTDVTDPNEQITSLDPIGFTDHYTTAQLGTIYPPPHTPGRTFQAQLAAGDSITSFTDDDGATHKPSQGGGLPAGPDHETLGGGPFHSPVPTPPSPAYPNAIYYCSQSLTEAECSRSDDGGVSFGPGVVIYTPSQCLGGIHGHIKVSPQGTVYVPNSSCAVGNPPGANGAAVSTDNGITWTEVTVPGSTGSQDPSIGIGQNNVGKPIGQAANTSYLGWISADGHAHVAHSGNEGATWQDDTDVGSILGVQNAVFPAVVAGDDNRAAFGFLGTTSSGIGAFSDDGNFHGLWHLYIATTYDGGHNWILIDATPDDPVQTGQVCLKGTGCNAARNLLDFNDFTVDAQGRGLFGYADGCVNCTNNFSGQSQSAKGTIARQSGGRRLFAKFDPVEPGLPAAPQVISAVRVGGPPPGVLVSWLEPDNGGSPITGYKIYRSTSSGTETFLATVLGNTTTKYLDTTAASSGNYFYRVTALNSVGEGPFCREVSINIVTNATACVAPYIKMGGPGIPGNISPDPSQGELTIESISLGEPFTTCNDNSVTFTMKVKTLDPANTGQVVLPSNAQWKFNFVVTTPDTVDHEIFVSLDTFAFNNASTASPNLSYGRKDPTATGTQEQMECFEQATGGVEVFHCPNLADGTVPSLTLSRDGTIRIKLNFSQILSFSTPQAPGTGSAFTWDGSAVGTTLKDVRGITVLLAGVFLETVQTTGIFPETLPGGHCATCPDYSRIGNVAGCNKVLPLAVLTANPLTGNAPLSVSFDGSNSFEPFGSCGTIDSYTLDFGDGSNPVTHSSPTFNHTYNTPGDYAAMLTVSDTAGHTSVNAAEVEIHVASITPPALATTNPVVSRMTHGTGGPTFDVNLPLTGKRGVECRSNGGNYKMVFTFQHNLVSVGSAGIATGTGSVTSSAIGPNPNQYTVNLSGVPNRQYISVNLLAAKDNTGAIGNVVGPQAGILIGDADDTGRVDGNDVSAVQSNTRQTVSGTNFRKDVDITGRIDGNDVSLTQSSTRTGLPSPP